MNIKKSCIFILLFVLSLNIFHGFLVSHHEHDINTLESNIIIDVDHDEICDECHFSHQNFTLYDIQPELPTIALFKPKFEQQDFTPPSNKITLFKPPTL